MRYILISLFILPAVSSALGIYKGARENSYTFEYAEDGAWWRDQVSIDKNGWPILNSHNRIQKSQRTQGLQALQKLPTDNVPLRNKNGVTLWPITNQWNWDWELRFTEWVKTELNSTWWKSNGISTDCADVVLSARWIFARNNGLPVANHLITGHWFTHESVKPEWENLPTAADWHQDQRFLAALDFLLSQAFTHSLWRDSYPVAINKQSLLPGGYHVHLDSDSGHVQFVYQIGLQRDQIPVLTLNSTVPRELRDLFEYVFAGADSYPEGNGFTRMRWPIVSGADVSLVPSEQMPHYSLEQFEQDFVQSPRLYFWEEVFHRLNPNANFDLIARKTLRQVADSFKARIPVVEKGYEICSANPCLEGSLEYEAWSTPSRDARILAGIGVYENLMPYVTDWAAIREILYEPILELEGYHYSYNLNELIGVWKEGRYSSNPNDEPRHRWGF